MGKGDEELYKRLFSFSTPPEEQLANTLYGLMARPPKDEPLNNMRRLADLGKRISSLPGSPPPVNPLLRNILGGASVLGGPIVPFVPAPLDKPTPPPSAPPALDIDYIRKFVDALTRRKALVKDGRVMPSIDDLTIMEGRRVNAAFVYSDLHGFTKLVASQPENKSFVFLDTFVNVASRLTKHYGGQVVDCAGDRVLSVFHRPPGDLSPDPVQDAVTFALYLQTAFSKVIGPKFAAGLGQLSLGIGIDYGPAVVGCVGIRNGKKIIFLGDAANYAAKLQEKATEGETILSYAADIRKPTYISADNRWWDLRREKTENGSTILRTKNVFAGEGLPKAR